MKIVVSLLLLVFISSCGGSNKGDDFQKPTEPIFDGNVVMSSLLDNTYVEDNQLVLAN